MNYGEQERFLSRHRRLAGGAAAAYAAGFAALAATLEPAAGAHALGVGALLAAATVYALWYLPLYLRLTVEGRKRYAWSVRSRVVALPVLALVALPVGGGAAAWGTWGACLALGALFVATARAQLKRHPDAVELPLVAAQLLAGDVALALFAAGSRTAPAAPLVAALGLALALYGAVAGRRGYAAGLAVGAAGVAGLCWIWWPALAAETALATAGAVARVAVLPAGALAAATALATAADARHRENVAETVESLSSFALVSPERAEELLATATGILARNWNENPPAGPTAVARWYEENSEYYLYDLAQFHLAYKHIAFMLDVVRLSEGRVLDYGAGIGDLALELARRGHDAVYLDVEGRTKAFARWRAERDWLPVEFASDLEEVEGEFDTIVSLDVFEHLAEPEPVIDALVDRLAPGGRMIVTAYFGATKAHPMHFDHDLDLGAFLASRGLRDAKTFAMRHLRSEFLGKRGVLVYEKPAR